jgi:hypothetical protein
MPLARWALGALALAGAVDAAGQGSRAAIAPIEMLTCHFAEGQGPEALPQLSADLDAWIRESQAPDYAAYALLPLLRSAEIDFELGWVRAWRDGPAMGATMAHERAAAATFTPLLGRVMRCDSARNFSMVTLREPAEAGRFGPLEVTTCTLRLGAALDDALQAVDEWVDYVATTGSTAAHWLLFPAYGESAEARYNFRWAIGYESFEGFGRDYEQLTNGDGLDKYAELLSHLVRCDSPRLYDVRPIRPRTE